jgi:sugar-specific transcriptional regulator TrmB
MYFYAILPDMNTSILVEAGLTEAQATAYTFLVQNSPIAPPRLSELINESRTNTYKILDTLEDLGLAQKDESDKKIKYWAKNPSSLLQVVQEKKQMAELQAKKLESSLPGLVNDFLKHNELPGVRFFQGKEGIKQIYEDTLNSKEEIYLIRSNADREMMSLDFYRNHSENRSKIGIKTTILTPSQVKVWDDETDKKYNISRIQIPNNSYSAPVEINIYENKVGLISFGEEAIGMIIESPQIAESMKQIFKLAQAGALTDTQIND